MDRGSHQAQRVTPAEKINDTLRFSLSSAWHFTHAPNSSPLSSKQRQEEKKREEIAWSEVSLRKYFQSWRGTITFCMLCVPLHRQKLQTQTCFSLFDGEEKIRLYRGCFIEVCIRDGSQRRSWYVILDGLSINILPGCDWKLSWMEVSQRSCWKQTDGWVGPREFVYESAGCNNQRVRLDVWKTVN